MPATQDLETFQNISIKDFEYFPVETSQGGNASNAGLKKFPNITSEDFESFSVESSQGGNAGNAGLRKISKYSYRGL